MKHSSFLLGKRISNSPPVCFSDENHFYLFWWGGKKHGVSFWTEQSEQRRSLSLRCDVWETCPNLRPFTSSLRSNHNFTSDFIEHFCCWWFKSNSKHPQRILSLSHERSKGKRMTNLHDIKSSLSFLHLNAALALDVSGPVLNYSISWQALRTETLYVEEILYTTIEPPLHPDSCPARCSLFSLLSVAQFFSFALFFSF